MRRAVSWRPVLSQVDTTQQAAFLVEGFDRYEEAQQPVDAFLAFGCDEPLLGAAAIPWGMSPTHRNTFGNA